MRSLCKKPAVLAFLNGGCFQVDEGLSVLCCHADNPNHETGWSPERAMKFGADHVTCFARIAPILLKERSTKDL